MSADATRDNVSRSATDKPTPRRLGRYDVLRMLDGGASPSTVFVGQLDDPGAARRPVAIKRIPTQGRSGVDVFLSTVGKVASLGHPNIVEVRELTSSDDEILIVMEYLEGESLAALIHQLQVANEQLPPPLTAFIGMEVASALDAAHERGVHHEHLTPHEIFIGYEGRVSVLDIGVAAAVEKLLANGASIRERELPYASPERCKGDQLDARADVFSLGAILWELLTGVSPFERLSEADTIRAIISEEPLVPPASVLRRLPTQLTEIATRAISRDRAKRYATTRALRHELRGYLRTAVPSDGKAQGDALGGSPSAPLAKLMARLFEDRIKTQAAWLNDATRSRNELATKPPPPMTAPEPPRELELDDVVEVLPEKPPKPPPPRPKAPSLPQANNKTLTESPSPPPSLGEGSLTESLATPFVVPVTRLDGTTTPSSALVSAPTPDAEPDAPRATSHTSEPAIHTSSTTSFEAALPLNESDSGLPPAELDSGAERRTTPLIVAILGAAVVMIVLFVVLGRVTSSTAGTPRSDPSAVMLASSRPVIAPPSSSLVEATSASSEPAPPVEVTLSVESIPPRAIVLLDGEVVGPAPTSFKVPRRTTEATLEIRSPGYQTLKETITPDVDQRLRLTMIPIPSKPAASPATAATTSAPPRYRRFD